MVRGPHGHQDRNRLPVQQHLRGRRRPGRVAGGGGLRPLRLGVRGDPLPGPVDGPGPASGHRPPLPPPSPSQARPEAAPAPSPTGIDYLGLLADRRDAELATSINYSQLTLPGAEPHTDNTDNTDNTDKEIQL